MKKIRLFLAVLILLLSLSMLLWALLPTQNERHTFPLPADGLQLPTPSAYIFSGEV